MARRYNRRRRVERGDRATASKDDPPFLIVHGEADRVVPVEQSQRLYEEREKPE